MSYRRESVVSDVTRTAEELPTIVAKLQTTALWPQSDTLYPFSKVLRLRVLQVVCGISVMLMGSVSCIENPAEISRLGLGIPAGIFTVLAAGASIHSSRGFGGYRPSSCPYSTLRFLGPSPGKAAFLTFLWAIACFLHVVLVWQALSVLCTDSSRLTQTSMLVAAVEMLLSVMTLLGVLLVVRIDCCYDPD